MDFPTAWRIARERRLSEHDPQCSYARANGALLCDCEVLTQHPQYLADSEEDSGQAQMRVQVLLDQHHWCSDLGCHRCPEVNNQSEHAAELARLLSAARLLAD